MLVKHLIKHLKKMDPEVVVGFVGNGNWHITGMSYGKVKGAKRGYVLLGEYGNIAPEDPGNSPTKK